MMKQLVLLAGLLAAMSGSAFASEQAAPEQGKTVEELTAACTACHGPTGVSPTTAFPIIAGQHKTYIEKALQDYRSGARKNAVMAGQVANLSDSDIEKLAAFYSKQESPLYTPSGD